MTYILIKGRQRRFYIRKEKKEEEAIGNVNAEAGIGMMQPQTKELQLPPKGARGKGQTSLEPLEGEPSY